MTLLLIFLFLLAHCGGEEISPDSRRDGKLLSLFQIIKFPNDPCAASNSRNGTCYTSSECTQKKGTSSGTCAQGFGVCCTFVLGCGQTSSQNCTYFENTGASAGTCKATICKCASNICQLRLDFTNFVITGPSTRTTSVTKILSGNANANGVAATDASQCQTDTFTVTPSTNVPVICGTLTGEHIYVDASNSCNDLSFNLGSASTGTSLAASRQWQIKVTQYSCDYSNRAPPGCLQYFYGTSGTGTVMSFNYGGSPSYHLANQKQSICVRRERGQCRICWSTVIASTDFQVSGKTNPPSAYVTGTSCCGYGNDGKKTKGYDCVMIPGASTMTLGALKPESICGRFFATKKTQQAAIATAKQTICSKQTPFQMSFVTDNWEFFDATAGEAKKSMGFRLAYSQTTC